MLLYNAHGYIIAQFNKHLISIDSLRIYVDKVVVFTFR